MTLVLHRGSHLSMYRQLDRKVCHTEAPPTVSSFHLESGNAYTSLRCRSYYVPDLQEQRVNRTVAESWWKSAKLSNRPVCEWSLWSYGAAWRHLPSSAAPKCTPPLCRRAVSWEPIIFLGFSVLTGDRECSSLAPSAIFWKKLPRTEVMFIPRTGSEGNLLSRVGNSSWVPWVTPELTEHGAVPNTPLYATIWDGKSLQSPLQLNTATHLIFNIMCEVYRHPPMNSDQLAFKA